MRRYEWAERSGTWWRICLGSRPLRVSWCKGAIYAMDFQFWFILFSRRPLFGALSRDFGACAGTEWGPVGAPEGQSFAEDNQKMCVSVGEQCMASCAVRVALVMIQSHYLLCFAFSRYPLCRYIWEVAYVPLMGYHL